MAGMFNRYSSFKTKNFIVIKNSDLTLDWNHWVDVGYFRITFEMNESGAKNVMGIYLSNGTLWKTSLVIPDWSRSAWRMA